jgi:hypothetical protein
MKVENEQIIVHADDEIKRMSEFVDRYTQEMEQSKQGVEVECQ